MKKRTVRGYTILTLLTAVLLAAVLMTGCENNDKPQDSADAGIQEEETQETQDTGASVSSDEAEEEEGSEPDNTMLNVDVTDAMSYSAIPAKDRQEDEEEELKIVEDDKDKVLKTEDGKVIIDLVLFMGQSNMSGTGGNASLAPRVETGHGYEFRAISDPTRLYPISEPFGVNENVTGAIGDTPEGKKGSLVSSFANKYYELTGVPIVAVSASAGGRDTQFFMSEPVVNDFSERYKRAQVWLESNDYHIRKQYVIWLQGESDAGDGLTTEQYNQNMDNIIRPLFIGGIQKVFMVTPGRTITTKYFFDNIVYSQINMCKTSGYYALATTVLNSVSTEYMTDEFHYNQSVLNVVGEEAAESAAYYTLNRKERCLYNYRDDNVYIPEGFEYTQEEMDVEKVDHNTNGDFVRY
ncbi:MAG: sialate O-acetylesterase [Lachnospiraceae bacterium]|nr:sialate O-acetylesterase [Lachnospiraceae bacterium]